MPSNIHITTQFNKERVIKLSITILKHAIISTIYIKSNNNYAAEEQNLTTKAHGANALRLHAKTPEFGVECATPARHSDRQARSSQRPPLPHRPENLQNNGTTPLVRRY